MTGACWDMIVPRLWAAWVVELTLLLVSYCVSAACVAALFQRPKLAAAVLPIGAVTRASIQFWYWMYGFGPPEPQWIMVSKVPLPASANHFGVATPSTVALMPAAFSSLEMSWAPA